MPMWMPIFRCNTLRHGTAYRPFASRLTKICLVVLLALLPSIAHGEDRFPPPEFRTPYQIPTTQTPAIRAYWLGYVDVAVLAVALGLAAYFVYRKRSRRGVFVLMLACLIYFGFYRKGCVCPIGAIQNVTLAIANPGYALPWVVMLFFLLPLAVNLFFGRVFCAGVCPLGAIQDAVVWKPIQLPYWIDASIGLFAYAYLGLAVMMAALGSNFVICSYDPFVSFFRLSGTVPMIFLGAVFLLAGMFVGRIYCRFICPYGVLLRLLSPFAKWRVSIFPDKCVNCRLCENSCPYGAIRLPTPPQPARISRADRLRFIAALLLVVVLPVIFWMLGVATGPRMATADPTVHLAQVVQRAEKGQLPTLTLQRDQLEVFRKSGQTPDDLYEQARHVQHRYANAAGWLGVWMGLVIALKLLSHVLRRRRTEYTADPGACLACARCFKLCPVDAAEPQEERIVAT